MILIGDFNAKLHIKKANKILQKQTRNGKLLQNMIDFNDLHIASTNSMIGLWTRINRTKPEERSVIDYIMVTRGLAHQIKKTIVDEIGTYRITGNKETDHNTIVMETGT